MEHRVYAHHRERPTHIALSMPLTTDAIDPVTYMRVLISVSISKSLLKKPTHLLHRHSRLNAARDGIDPGRKPEEVEALVLLTDRV